MKMTQQMRIKIHIDNHGPFDLCERRIKIQTMDGAPIGEGAAKQVRLNGKWILRQYNNPVPCGELTVLYPEEETSSYEILK